MCVLLSVLAFLLSVAPTTVQDVGSEEQALQEMWRQFQEFYNQDDAEGVASLYALDADRDGHTGGSCPRAPEIQEMYAAGMAERVAVKVDSQIGGITIRFLRPDVAILDGEGELVAPSSRVRYVFTVIAMKENGRWWIAAGRPRGTVREP